MPGRQTPPKVHRSTLAMKGLGWLVIPWLVACQPAKRQLAAPVEALSFIIPANLGQPLPFPSGNPLTRPGVALGRKLFYDPILSANHRLACATCHQQKNAFTDGLVLSNQGVSNEILRRHVPSLVNLAWMKGLFWEGGATGLESLAVSPIHHPDEMGKDLRVLVAELQAHPQYPGLFKAAFGSDSITVQEVVRALSQFERTLVSANSRYDRYVRKEASGLLTDQELRGLALFQQKCASCHEPDLFTDNGYHNNGIDSAFSNIAYDRIFQGRYRITYDPRDLGKFKTSTLRNNTLTAPYMHDGRFPTLEVVINHYSEGIRPSATLDPRIPVAGFQFDRTEKEALLAFLRTLEDQTFIHNPAYKKP